MNYPKISIITPVFNQVQYIEQAILSIINQDYPNLEYIIIDGGSTDGTVDIIKQYQNKLAYWISESDQGMYYALDKGFKKSTGEIMGWLNSDDMLHPNSLFSIAEIMCMPEVNWLMGAPSYFDTKGRCVRTYSDEKWSRLKYHTNGHAYIQQESTYWKRELWEKSGGYISTNFKLAGDFELWGRFFKYEKLYTPHCLIGGYRMLNSGQLTADYQKYTSEADEILKDISSGLDIGWKEKIKKLSQLQYLKVILRKSRILNLHFITNRIERKINNLHEYPAKIEFDRKSQSFKVSSN